jgi:hypothetical protein
MRLSPIQEGIGGRHCPPPLPPISHLPLIYLLPSSIEAILDLRGRHPTGFHTSLQREMYEEADDALGAIGAPIRPYRLCE